jgi:KH domain
VDIDPTFVIDGASDNVRTSVLNHIDRIATYTGTDMFLLNPKTTDPEVLRLSYGGGADTSLDQRYRVNIFGDIESVEHAKTRVLMMIDQIVRPRRTLSAASLTVKQLKYKVDAIKLELTMHTLVCGRTRKNIKLIESATKTAIYFPPPFPRVFGYVPPGATRRSEDEVFITGETQERIQQAKQKLRELVMGVKIYVKDVMVNCNKIDNILLDRLDKVRKVMETNGSYVLFPQLGSQRGMVRVQGTEVLHVERTVREIMALVRSYGQ